MTPQPPTPERSKIFISYRRDDSAGHAGRLYDSLVAHFSREQIFMDVDAIEPGEDFFEVIENAMGACGVLVVIIGRQWLESADAHGRRLDRSNDWVRLEVAAALEKKIRVIPVLVQGAAMPSAELLPETLATLARRQAFELSDLRWYSDVERLAASIKKGLQKTAPPPAPPVEVPPAPEPAPPPVTSAPTEAEKSEETTPPEKVEAAEETATTTTAQPETTTGRETAALLETKVAKSAPVFQSLEPDRQSSSLFQSNWSNSFTAEGRLSRRTVVGIGIWLVTFLMLFSFFVITDEKFMLDNWIFCTVMLVVGLIGLLVAPLFLLRDSRRLQLIFTGVTAFVFLLKPAVMPIHPYFGETYSYTDHSHVPFVAPGLTFLAIFLVLLVITARAARKRSLPFNGQD